MREKESDGPREVSREGKKRVKRKENVLKRANLVSVHLLFSPDM